MSFTFDIAMHTNSDTYKPNTISIHSTSQIYCMLLYNVIVLASYCSQHYHFFEHLGVCEGVGGGGQDNAQIHMGRQL